MLGSERAERRPIRFSKWWLAFLVVASLGLFMNSYAADTSSKPSPAPEGCTENQAKTNPPSGQQDDANVSGLEGEEAELGIAVNPTDESNRVIAGHSPCRTVLNTFHTLNNGVTWSRRSLGCQGTECDWDSLTVGATRYDPTVAFGPDGALYVAYGVSADGEDLVCARSMDGGVTFDRFAYVASAYALDKYLLTTGPKVGDPDHYNVYLTYSTWNGNGNWEVHLASCTNPTGTDFAFTRDLRMSPDEADESHTFAMPGVDAEGTVYVVWDDITDRLTESHVMIAASSDEGLHVDSGSTEVIATTPISFNGTGLNNDMYRIPAQPMRGILAEPCIAVDRSDGPRRGRVYVSYTTLGTGGTYDTDVVVRFREPGSGSWSTATRVHSASTNSQFNGWIDVDAKSGATAVAWHDARADYDNEAVRVWLAYLNETDQWIEMPVADAESNEAEQEIYDDDYREYLGLDVFNGTAYVAWADNSGDGDLDYFTDWKVIGPRVMRVPEFWLTPASALAEANPGDEVSVAWNLGQPYTDSLFVESGRRVVAREGEVDRPILDARGFHCGAKFAADADSTTVLSGFEILVGGAGAWVGVGLSGEAKLIDCVVTNPPGTAAPDTGISVNGSGEVRDCTVTLVSDTAWYVGIGIGAGNPVVTGCQVRALGASYGTGIRAGSGTGAVITWCFVSATRHGIDAGGTTLTKFCTVDSTHFEGIVNGNYAVVENSIVTNVLYDNPPYSPHPGIFGGTARYCIAPNGIQVPAGHGEGNTIEDPLYCGDGEYTLRIDSYGNPWNNPTGQPIGANHVGCMSGELVRSSKASYGTIRMTGVTTIPADKSLTLTNAVAFEADTLASGERASIHVYGALRATGAPIVFRGASSVPGFWDGIVLTGEAARLNLSGVEIRDAYFGIRDGFWAADSLVLWGVTIAGFEEAGVMLTGYFNKPTGLFQVGGYSVIDMQGASYGIYVNPDGDPAPGTPRYSTDLTNVHVTGDADGLCGIYMDGPAEIFVSSVASLSTGTGIYVENGNVGIDRGAIEGCKWGVQARGTGTVSITGTSQSNLPISGCTTGIYARDSQDVTADRVAIGSIPSGGIGLYTDYSAGGTFTHVSINGGASGFKSYGTGAQTYFLGNITGFASYGVLVGVASPVILGDSDTGEGRNSIHSESSTAKYVSAKNHLAELGSVNATWNWWGEYPAPSTKFTTLTVDYQPELQTVPPQGAHVKLVELPAALALMVAPNPCRDRVLIRADIPTLEKSVDVEVFDVTGRRVRVLVTGKQPAGRREISWDGLDERGSQVPGGIYFVRLRAGETTRTARILRIR